MADLIKKITLLVKLIYSVQCCRNFHLCSQRIGNYSLVLNFFFVWTDNYRLGNTCIPCEGVPITTITFGIYLLLFMMAIITNGFTNSLCTKVIIQSPPLKLSSEFFSRSITFTFFFTPSLRRLMTLLFISFAVESSLPFFPDGLSDISHQDPVASAYSESCDWPSIRYFQFQCFTNQ